MLQIIAAVCKGLGVGVIVAAPVGPMSLLCMRRTLASGWQAGWTIGLGIATGDGIFAFFAAAGLVGVSRFTLVYAGPLHVVAGVCLLYIALRSSKSSFGMDGDAEAARVSRFAFASAVLLTLTNPPTIVSFFALFAVLAPPMGFDAQTAVSTVAGVFVGSACWWLVLALAVSTVRRSVGPRTRRWLNGVSTAVLALFGLAEIYRALNSA